jgi:hypothetical protein
MANLALTDFNDFADLISRQYTDDLESIKSSMEESGMVKTTVVPRGSGETRRHKEHPHKNQYASYKAEGAQSVAINNQVGYYKDTFSKTFSSQITITLEMRELGKDQDIIRSMTDLTSLAPNRIDLDLSLRLSFMTATSYTDRDGQTVDTSIGDGYALAYTAHTLTGSATTARNRLAGNPQLSRGAIENMEYLGVTEMFNNLGEQIMMEYDVLWTTDNPNTVNTAREILQSTAEISAPNAGVINVYKAKYRHVVLPRSYMNAAGVKQSSKAKYWGLASTRSSSFFRDVYIQPFLTMPREGSNGEDINTLDWTFTTTYADSNAIVDYRWFLASSGDAAA